MVICIYNEIHSQSKFASELIWREIERQEIPKSKKLQNEGEKQIHGHLWKQIEGVVHETS